MSGLTSGPRSTEADSDCTEACCRGLTHTARHHPELELAGGQGQGRGVSGRGVEEAKGCRGRCHVVCRAAAGAGSDCRASGASSGSLPMAAPHGPTALQPPNNHLHPLLPSCHRRSTQLSTLDNLRMLVFLWHTDRCARLAY